MIELKDIQQISSKLSMEIMGMESDDLGEDISCIVYRADVFEAGDDVMIDRHIDIEYSFGEYYEVCEDTSLFQFICSLCNLSLLQEEQEIILYQKNTACDID